MVIVRSVRPWNDVVEDDDRGPAGRGARDLDRVLDRLRAGVDEDRPLLLARARRELREPAADLDVRLVHPDHEALVQVAVDLLVDRGDGRREPVAGVLAAEPAGEVDVLAAVDVPDACAFRPVDDERAGWRSRARPNGRARHSPAPTPGAALR